jgi:integrase
MRSPKHKLTRSGRGWFKRIGPEVKWICSAVVAPTGDEADAIFETKFADLCRPKRLALDVKELANQFLARKKIDRDNARLDVRTLRDYQNSLKHFRDCVGESRQVRLLGPMDFSSFASSIAHFSVHRRYKHINNVRIAMNWATAMRLIEPPDYGADFHVPTRGEFRKARARRELDQGKRMYSAEQIGKLIAYPHQWNMRAMILLALNAGFGNTDLAELNWSCIDLIKSVIQYRRGKTGIARLAPLWSETIAALRALKYPHDQRPADGRVFVTRQGFPLLDERGKDSVASSFTKLCRQAGVENHGFYSLRRTFRTLADENRDARATALIMGRQIGDIDELYVQDIDLNRLKKITDHVRARLKVSHLTGLARAEAAKAAAGRSQRAKAWRARSRRRAIPPARAGKSGIRQRSPDAGSPRGGRASGSRCGRPADTPPPRHR